MLESLQWKGSPLAKPFTHVIENRSGIITVDTDDTVFGNGMYDGHFNTDLKHDNNGIIRPYALSLVPSRPARRADDRPVLGLLGAGHRQQSGGTHADRDRDQSGLCEADRAGAGSRLAADQSQGHASSPTTAGAGCTSIRERHFDAIVSNTTWHFRANVTNLLSAEFLALVKDHLNPGGIFFYNTTDSARAQRTGCLAFGEGARFTNHMVVSPTPIAWDFAALAAHARSLSDRRPRQFDPARGEDRALLDQLMAMEASLTSKAPLRRAADRALPRHPRPHRRQADHDRRQHGQRVALFPRFGLRPRLSPTPSLWNLECAQCAPVSATGMRPLMHWCRGGTYTEGLKQLKTYCFA